LAKAKPSPSARLLGLSLKNQKNEEMNNLFGKINIPLHTGRDVHPKFNILNTSDLNLITTQDILDFLKESGIKQFELAELQSKNADKQFRNSTKLTILALIFAFISIVPVLREYIPIFETKNLDRDVYELKNKVLYLSNTNLANQVRILKVENELLKSKKTYEKKP
jgi:hypothetical protein